MADLEQARAMLRMAHKDFNALRQDISFTG